MSIKLGILGGGQLGKMMLTEIHKLDIEVHILDPSADCPSAASCKNLTIGSFKDFDTVYQFGKNVDVLTIEIEQVNVDALDKLKAEGITIHPSPEAIRLIQDKGLQKAFYVEHGIPTSDFELYDSADQIRSAVANESLTIPFVQKSRKDGYDGKGVFVVKTAEHLEQLMDVPSVVEDLVDIDKEIAVIVAQDDKQVRAFPPVEMAFHPTANLVEFLLCPAQISTEVAQKAEAIAKKTLSALNMKGLLAVELFLKANGDILVNEVAPRAHNSGHHTIESTVVSQYEQHLRSICGMPVGSTDIKMPAAMVNLLGEDGFSGPVVYDGLNDALKIDGVSVHLYGKKETRPFRKMGHITVCDNEIEAVIQKAKQVRSLLKVKA